MAGFLPSIPAGALVRLPVQAVLAVALALAVVPARASDDRLAVLPYTLSVIEPFRVASVTGGTGVLLTVGEKDVDPEATQPQVIVTYTQTSAPRSDLKRIADVVLNAVGDDVRVASQEAAPFAGLDGLATKGALVENGVETGFAHWVAYTGDGVPIQFLGTAAEERYGVLGGAIEAIAASIRLKQ